MTKTGPVLAAIDLTASSDEALRQAHDIAASRGIPCVACHVLPEAYRVRVLFPQDSGVDVAEQSELDASASAAVRGRLETVLGPAAGSIDIRIEMGSPHAGILELAERIGAGLIVVGAGATALRVARSAHCPVLIARPSPVDGAVIGATDFSDPALPAVHMAAAEARRRHAPLTLVHCLDVDETAAMAAAAVAGVVVMPVFPMEMIAQLKADAAERLTKALAEVGAVGMTAVLEHTPEAGIIEAASETTAALVVVGTRGRTGFARLMLGSTAEAVVDRSPCSVMVVPLAHPPTK